MLRVVTNPDDGRWIVIGMLYGREVTVYDPDTADVWTDLQMCLQFKRENA